MTVAVVRSTVAGRDINQDLTTPVPWENGEAQNGNRDDRAGFGIRAFGPDDDGQEALRHLSLGASACFRWLEITAPATRVEVVGRGEGPVEIATSATGDPIGVVEMTGQLPSAPIELPAGKHEFWIRAGPAADVEVTTFIVR